MKTSIYIILFLCIVCFSFRNYDVIEELSSNKTLGKNTLNDTLNCKESKMRLLTGIWAENIIDNAIFEIANDSLYYFEDYDNPVSLELTKNAFIIKGAVPVECKILKLTTDSLWYIDEFSDDTTKLYKR